MKFAYRGISSTGAKVTDVIDAPDLAQAIESLRQDGLFVTDIDESTSSRRVSRGTAVASPAEPGRLNSKELLLFTRQMTMLLRAGSPIVPTLVAISKQMSGTSKLVIDAIHRDTEGGRGLADAMREFPGTFPETYIAIVNAGEMSATLPEMFARLGTMLKRNLEIRNRVVSAAAYPVLLICLSSSIITTMIVFVVPRFKSLFASLNAPLPFSTQVMFGASDFARGNWMWLVGAAAVVVIASITVCKTRAGRQWLCDLQTQLPVVGRLLSNLLLAQMYRVMGLLLESRVGLMDTLALAGRVSSNKTYQQLNGAMADSIEQGNGLSEALSKSAMVSPSVAQAISIGEQSGNLDQAMLFVADILDEENFQLINTVTKLLEPLILIMMGFVVGGIALSLFIPLFDLAALAN